MLTGPFTACGLRRASVPGTSNTMPPSFSPSATSETAGM